MSRSGTVLMRVFVIPTVLGLAISVAVGLAQSHAGTPAVIATRTASLGPIERIKAGERDCRGCDLHGADLSNQCVKGGDLTGANFERVKALYMCMSMANFTNVNFRNADLTGANLAHSNLSGADLTGAVLDITSIKGADLSRSVGLTQAQLDQACADTATKVPAGLRAKSCS
jgi:uncharacterized protein YjbI with pentapeptide repeats